MHTCVRWGLEAREREGNLGMKAQQWENKEAIPMVKIFYPPKLMDFRAICLVGAGRFWTVNWRVITYMKTQLWMPVDIHYSLCAHVFLQQAFTVPALVLSTSEWFRCVSPLHGADSVLVAVRQVEITETWVNISFLGWRVEVRLPWAPIKEKEQWSLHPIMNG